MKNKNITLINPFVWENFWDKCSDFDSIDEMEKQYNDFVDANKEIISTINEMMEKNDYTALKEQYGYDIEGESLNEAVLGKRKQHVPTSDVNDGFAEDAPFSGAKKKPSSKPRTIDDIEAEEASKNVKVIPQQRPALTDVDVKVVSNVSYDSHSMNDIHYCVQTIYAKLLKQHKNYKTITPLSLLDTEAVVEMDALFAFMDIPNVDLSRYNTSNVKNMEGMFYKSTFNNDSIRYWDVSKVVNMRNMFIGSDMTNPDYIAAWYPNTINHALPKLGVDNQEDLDDDAAVDRLFGDDQDIERKYKERMSYNYNESWHVMSSSEFIAEGKFKDFVKRGVDKVKSMFSTVSITLKNGATWVFDKFGEMLNVITPDTTRACIKSHRIAGVSLGENWQPTEEGYYDFIEKGSKEYSNYVEFMKMASSGKVNEARVTLSANRSKAEGAAAPNIDAPDWNTEKLSHFIRKQVELTQKDPGREKPTLVVWGAPGIGKSSIPKTIIRQLNEMQNRTTEKDRMTVLVADCSQMSSDGFSLPTPAKQIEIAKMIESSEAAKLIADQNDMSVEELNSIEYKVSSDAPKTWLPVYKPTGIREKDDVLNALANGYVQPIKKGNRTVGFEKTGSGGILLIDEFLRADRNVFFTVCQLMFEYAMGGGEYVLGDKWQIIAASNRPSDDTEVRRNFADSAGAGFNRLLRCNFVPSFDDWRKNWAEDHGFDETTLSFIAGKGIDTPDSRWHNFDPELKNSQNNPAFASPRSWAQAIKNLQDECEYSGYENYGDMPKSLFKDCVESALPSNLAEEYTDYYYMNNVSVNPYSYDKIIANPKLTVKNKEKYKCANAADVVTTTVRLRYSKKNRIPVDEFAAIMEFFCRNYPENSDVIYTELYQKILDICSIVAPADATPEEIEIENSYDKVGDIFAKAFPVFVQNLSEE